VNVGPSLTFQNPPDWKLPWPEVYERTIELAVAAEDLGFDQIWLPEHHFCEDGFCPSLLPVAAAIAARTSKIRIGTKILILPLHDPVRVAEDIAVVDQISNGRLDVGFAGGYRNGEFEGFGISPKERGGRMNEGLEVLAAALSGEEFEHAGRYYQYGKIKVVPPPTQSPVPMWLGGRAKASMRRAAKFRANLVLADLDATASEEDVIAYREALAAEGLDPAGYDVCAVASVFLDRDSEKAWKLAGEHILYQMNQYITWFNETADRQFGSGLMSSVDELSDAAALVGSPDSVLERIHAYHERVPFTHFSFFGILPGMNPNDAMGSLELFASDLLPYLRRLDQTPVA
jgi:alkanesulfonate monooxygenase SsuD/methylene tetrahydromethanopterin reductase-like flavin-dependent oxidoreductase (luciferase family)